MREVETSNPHAEPSRGKKFCLFLRFSKGPPCRPFKTFSPRKIGFRLSDKGKFPVYPPTGIPFFFFFFFSPGDSVALRLFFFSPV